MEEFHKQRRWKEVSREIHEWASTLKEKSHTWNKSCKDSAKREGDILKLAELAAQDETQEDEERRDIKKLLKQLRKDRKDEDEARALLKQMQINVEGAQARSAATELRCSAGSTSTWDLDEDRGRPNFIMDKICQMLQSNDTKTLNLTKDFEEL